MSTAPPLEQSLPERTQFFFAVLIGVFLSAWVSWFSPFDDLLDRSGTPVGADFSMFYVGGQIVRDGVSDRLYDQAEHQRRLHELVPGIAAEYCLPYRYPPIVAVLMAPLTRLPYLASYLVFSLLSVAAGVVAVRMLHAHLGVFRRERLRPLLLVVFGWPITLEILIGGQASLFALAICAGTFACLRKRQLVAAGAILALAAYKPNVLALVGIGLIVRYPRMLFGAVPVFLGLVLAPISTTGWDRLSEYGVMLGRLSSERWSVESPWWKVQSLAGPLSDVIGDRARIVCLVTGACASVTVGILWRRRAATKTLAGRAEQVGGSACDAAMWSHLLVINALLNPYTPIYDLILVGLAAVLLSEYSLVAANRGLPLSQSTLLMLWALLSFGPHLSQAIARIVGVQLFPLLLAVGWISVWIALSVRKPIIGNSLTADS